MDRKFLYYIYLSEPGWHVDTGWYSIQKEEMTHGDLWINAISDVVEIGKFGNRWKRKNLNLVNIPASDEELMMIKLQVRPRIY